MTEEWKDIPGYEGLYEASNLGRIRTNKNKITINSLNHIRHWKQRIIKQHYRKTKQKNGVRLDAMCTLWKDGKPHYHLCSRLVAMTWCDGYKEGLTVNHIDGNPTNNTASNLEWITIGDNVRHGIENGKYSNCQRPITLTINGEEVSFPSMVSASLFFGKNKRYVASRMRTRSGRIEIGYEK